VDLLPPDGSDPAESVRTIIAELEKFSPELAERERWLVLNKADLLPEEERDARCAELVAALNWEGPVHTISALSGEGTARLVQQVMTRLEELRREDAVAESSAEPQNSELPSASE